MFLKQNIVQLEVVFMAQRHFHVSHNPVTPGAQAALRNVGSRKTHGCWDNFRALNKKSWGNDIFFILHHYFQQFPKKQWLDLSNPKQKTTRLHKTAISETRWDGLGLADSNGSYMHSCVGYSMSFPLIRQSPGKGIFPHLSLGKFRAQNDLPRRSMNWASNFRTMWTLFDVINIRTS